MAQSDRKEINKAEAKPEASTLKPFYQTPKCLSGDFKVEIDDLSKRLIEKGDSKTLNLFGDEVKATLGQRYVIVVFIKDNIVHLRTIPGFEYVENIAKRQELAAKAAKFFNCDIDDVAFPNHAIWTGVVHQQLINQIRKKEPTLEVNSTIIAFSMIKNNDKYSWLNRSGINEDVFCPDPLASACYVFVEKSDYSDYKPPAFDLYYHLKRAIPEKIFKKMITALTEKICEDDPTPLARLSLDECTNFAYEFKWQTMQKLYIEDRAQAVAKIQHMLMRNLHAYLSGLSASEEKDRAEQILKGGFTATQEIGLLIDIDINPPEFIDDINALAKTKINNHSGMLFFLTRYKENYTYHLLITALKENQIEKAQAVLRKMNDIDKKMILIEIIENALPDGTFEVINMIYEASQLPSEKEQICQSVCAYIRRCIISAEYDYAKKYIEALPKVVLFDYIKNNLLTTSFYSSFFSFSLLHHFAETLLEEKPDFNKKNKDGLSLLHYAASSTGGSLVVSGLLDHQADPYIKDNNGLTPLHYAARSGRANMTKILLEKKVDPNVTDGSMKLPLEYALAGKDFSTVQLLLEHGARFPDPFLLSNDLIIVLKESICIREFKLLPILMQTITKEDNPILQQQIVSVVYQTFVGIPPQLHYLDGIREFLKLSGTVPQNVINFDPKKIIDAFFSFLQIIDDQSREIDFIDLMLDDKSIIGQSLLHDKTYGDDFRKKLNDLKLSTGLNLQCKLFRLHIICLDINQAKECIQSFPRQIILPYIQKDKKTTEIMCHIADILSEEKLDFNKKNSAGKTLLHMAAECESKISFISSLLPNNVDPNILDSKGNSALSIAASKSNWLLVNLLIEYKANPNIGSSNGKTPLELALVSNEKEVVFCLLENGAKFPESFATDSAYVAKIMSHLNVMFNLTFREPLNRHCVGPLDEFNKFLNKIESKKVQHDMISYVLNPKSAIGWKLLKSDSSLKTFPSLGEIFRQNLNKMKSNIEKQMRCEEEKNRSPSAECR